MREARATGRRDAFERARERERERERKRAQTHRDTQRRNVLSVQHSRDNTPNELVTARSYDGRDSDCFAERGA